MKSMKGKLTLFERDTNENKELVRMYNQTTATRQSIEALRD